MIIPSRSFEVAECRFQYEHSFICRLFFGMREMGGCWDSFFTYSVLYFCTISKRDFTNKVAHAV